MAINFNLRGLLQDEEFLLGAGLLSAGSQGQNLGQAALPQLINAAKTANAFQNIQRVKDVRDEISKMDMSGMTDLEKAILKLDPIKGYSMIAKKNAKPKKSGKLPPSIPTPGKSFSPDCISFATSISTACNASSASFNFESVTAFLISLILSSDADVIL